MDIICFSNPAKVERRTKSHSKHPTLKTVLDERICRLRPPLKLYWSETTPIHALTPIGWFEVIERILRKFRL